MMDNIRGGLPDSKDQKAGKSNIRSIFLRNHMRISKSYVIVCICFFMAGFGFVSADNISQGTEVNNSSIHSGINNELWRSEQSAYSDSLLHETLLSPSMNSNKTSNISSNFLSDLDMRSGTRLPEFKVDWDRSLGGSKDEMTYSAAQTADGGYIVAGYTYSEDGDIKEFFGGWDIWIAKLDTARNLEWAKSLGGSGDDYAMSVIQNNAGEYLIAGYTDSTDGDITTNHGGFDYWVIKLDTHGNLIWQKCLGGSKTDEARSIKQTSDGGYLIGGYTWSDDGDVSGHIGTYDYWIVKLNSSGKILWNKCLGGSSWDYAVSAIETVDKGYFIGGFSISRNGNVTGNHGGFDYWVVKLNSQGELVFEKSLGGSKDELLNSAIQTRDGGYLLIGSTESNDGNVTGNHGGLDYWIVKLDSTGLIEWQKCFGGSSYEKAYSAVMSPAGGYAVAGSTHSTDGDVSENHGAQDYWLISINSLGTLEWEKCFGGSNYDYGFNLILNTDQSYCITGISESIDGDVSGNHGWWDYWLVQVSVWYSVESASDEWSIVYPHGNLSYIEGSNAAYITQGKPGAILEDVKIDSTSYGPLQKYTFQSIASDHSIHAYGNPVKDQVHVMFNITPTSGMHPLDVTFSDMSLGNPTSWFWQFGDGGTSIEKEPSHTYRNPGSYTVSLQAFNNQTSGFNSCTGCIEVN